MSRTNRNSVFDSTNWGLKASSTSFFTRCRRVAASSPDERKTVYDPTCRGAPSLMSAKHTSYPCPVRTGWRGASFPGGFVRAMVAHQRVYGSSWPQVTLRTVVRRQLPVAACLAQVASIISPAVRWHRANTPVLGTTACSELGRDSHGEVWMGDPLQLFDEPLPCRVCQGSAVLWSDRPGGDVASRWTLGPPPRWTGTRRMLAPTAQAMAKPTVP